MTSAKKDEFIKFIKFSLIGVSNTLIDMFVFFICRGPLNIPMIPASIISFTVSVLNSYFWNRRWTFKSDGKFFSPKMVQFLVVNIVTMLVGILLLELFVKFTVNIIPFHEELTDLARLLFSDEPTPQETTRKAIEFIGKFFNLPFIVLFNFLGNRLWTFRK